MGGGEKSDKDRVEEEDTDNEASVSAAEDDDDEENSNKIQLGPQCTLKEQIEKDKVSVLPSKFLSLFFFFDVNRWLTFVFGCSVGG